jgi:hypothetical protein
MLAELSAEMEVEAPVAPRRRPRIDRAVLAQYDANQALYYAELRNTVRMFKDIQKTRVGTGERVRAIAQGRAQGATGQLDEIHGDLGTFENMLKRSVEILIEQHPLYEPWFSRVRGVGSLSVGQLMGIVGTVEGYNGQAGIGAFDTVSKFWRFCGVGLGQYYVVKGEVVAPVTGNKIEGEGEKRRVVKHSPKPPKDSVIEWRIDKPMAGYVLPYSKEAKTVALEFIGSNFIKQNGAYRRIYDEAKSFYHAVHADWSDGHCHNAARRKMVKVWLADLWHLWREAEGYSTRGLWVHEYGEHTTVYDWREFLE